MLCFSLAGEDVILTGSGCAGYCANVSAYAQPFAGSLRYFSTKSKRAPLTQCPLTLSKDYKKDIFSILADGVELLHKRLRLLYITFNFMAADKNYLYFLF